MGLTKAEALRIHTTAMACNPRYRAFAIQKATPNVRICNATGRYTVLDLSILFDLPETDIKAILKGCR